MSVLDKVRPRGESVPPEVEEKVKRGRERMEEGAGQARESYLFWKGDQYVYRTGQGYIMRFSTDGTTIAGAPKPPWRVRTVRNFIKPAVENKVSAATQRVPGYEVVASTTEQNDRAAASIATKVAYYLHDRANVRRATAKVVTSAVVMNEGFALPYWDPTVGPYVEVGEDEYVGVGEVKIKTFDRNQVFWEAGVDFYESRWHATDEALPVSDVESWPNLLPGKRLSPDADTSYTASPDNVKDQVLVTTYYERPSAKNPHGLRLVIANKRVILPPEPYPCVDDKGEYVDEPVLHKLAYTVDPSSDRDLGLVPDLLDAQRTINDTVSKTLEWKNRCLNPQLSAPVGSMKTRKTDEPGAINYYVPVGGMKPEWETVPAIPESLFRVVDQAVDHLRHMSADAELSASPDVAARTVQAVIERMEARSQSFIGDLAEFHSRLSRHMLYLVARHYTEGRLVKIRGENGWETIKDFTGAQLRGQCDVRVSPESITPRTKAGMLETLTWINANFPGYLNPEQAVSVILGGGIERIVERFEKDYSAAGRFVARLKEGPEAFLNAPMRVEADPLTGALTQVPSWMPNKWDDERIWKSVLESFLKSEGFETSEPGVQEAARIVYDALLALEAQKQAQAAMAQMAQAEGLGMDNAAKPQEKGMPSSPKMGPEN